jgi:predicted Fe-S protein YdhL (DUF1289 family)
MATASPCIGTCRLGNGDICLGCGRSLCEIAEWSSAAASRQEAILAAARERRARHELTRAPGA